MSVYGPDGSNMVCSEADPAGMQHYIHNCRKIGLYIHRYFGVPHL